MYIPIWNKYRPALLKLMLTADEGPQEYHFFSHEFKQLNPKEKGGYSFTLQVFRGKAQNNIRDSFVAQDLLYVLESSRKASELLERHTYEFSMDKKFVLQVSQIKAEQPANEAES